MNSKKIDAAIRENLILTKGKAYEVIGGCYQDEFSVIENKITGHGRWVVWHTVVIKRKSDGKFFKDEYSVGATEAQEAYDYEPNFTEVFPVETTIITYI